MKQGNYLEALKVTKDENDEDVPHLENYWNGIDAL